MVQACWRATDGNRCPLRHTLNHRPAASTAGREPGNHVLGVNPAVAGGVATPVGLAGPNPSAHLVGVEAKGYCVSSRSRLRSTLAGTASVALTVSLMFFVSPAQADPKKDQPTTVAE